MTYNQKVQYAKRLLERIVMDAGSVDAVIDRLESLLPRS